MTDHRILKAGVMFLTESNSDSNFSPFEVRKFLVEQYHFFESPTTIEEMFDAQGSVFKYGEFNDEIIRELSLEPTGFTAEATRHTDLTEAFLEDVIRSLNLRFSLDTVISIRAFDSIIEINFPSNPLQNLLATGALLDDVNGNVAKGGLELQPLELSRIQFTTPIFDESDSSQLTFTLERRAGRSYDSNTFFSQAPLRTEVHLDILRKHFST
jgi:hypothetical protein